MPTFKLTDPNSGRTLNVTGDSPPSQQEIEQIFNQFQVEQVPEVDPVEAQRTQLLQDLASEQGPLDAALISAGRGLTNVGRGLGLIDEEDPTTKAAITELQEQRPISTTVGEILGETAPFLLPGGAIAKFGTIPGRVAAAGSVGALEGNILARGRGADETQALQAAGIGGGVASALELAFPVIGRIGGKIFRNVTGRQPKTPLFNNQGEPSQEFIRALDKAGLSFDDVTAEANRLIDVGEIDDAVSLGRKEFLETQGITPTKAQITGDATEFQAQQELAKTSGRVRRALEGQEAVLSNKFENAVTATGGSANKSNSPVIDFIADRSIDLDKQISDAYKAARDIAPTEKVVKPTSLVEGIRSIGASDRATGGLGGAVRDILNANGVLQKGKLKAIGRVDAQTAEQIRIDMNGLFDTLTPFGKKKLAGLKNALDNDVEKAVGKDIFSGARSAKAQFEKDLSRAKVNKFDARKKNLVRDILENKINPDRFLNDAVLSKTVRSTDLEQLKRYLQLDGDGLGVDAWNDLRAETMDFIRTTAVKEVAGEPALSRAGLEKALGSLGRDKLRVLFSQEERKFLNDMLKTSKLREPVRGTALGKGPSAQAIRSLTNAVNRIPLINSVFGGATELLTTDIAGRSALRQPSQQVIRPGQLSTLAAPAVIAGTTQEQ
jgi:hypothetical protein